MKKKKTLRLTSTAGRVVNTIDIDQDGYLVIDSLHKVDAFIDFVTTRTHTQVQSHFSSEGFTSYGSDVYGEEYWSQTVTEAEAADYILNADLVVQLLDVLYRPHVGSSCTGRDWDFLIAMTVSNKTSGTYEKISSGIYHGDYMNRFATYPDSNSYNIDDYMSTDPNGLEEITTSECPTEERWPRIGYGGWSYVSCVPMSQHLWVDWDADGWKDPTYMKCREREFFFFGLNLWDQENCHEAEGCAM